MSHANLCSHTTYIQSYRDTISTPEASNLNHSAVSGFR